MSHLKKAHDRFSHSERHGNMERIGWIRAAVLGANDGVVSTSALVMALLAGNVSSSTLVISISSALLAGACSMAIGEYVSVSSQKDIEETTIAIEKQELEQDPKSELAELAAIYRARGLNKDLAQQVAVALTEHDPLQAHLRDELGIIESERANPFQAAYVSFIAFTSGGLLPFISSIIVHNQFAMGTVTQLFIVAAITGVALAVLGYLGASLGGAKPRKAVIRVLIGGSAALIVTSLLGIALG